MKHRYLVFGLFFSWCLAAAQPSAPIIDMHMHALAADAQGPPPLGLCLPTTTFGSTTSASSWGATMLQAYKEPACPDPIWSAETDDALLEQTLAVMERRNIYGVTSGPQLPLWQERAANRIIPGTIFLFDGGPNSASVDVLRPRFEDGTIRVFGEITLQYRGFSPAHPDFEPYLALAEELDVPIAIHMGPGPPGAPYLGRPNYRASLSSPLLLEDVLVRHPGLRVQIMHAGWPMLDDLLAVLWAHPQVYAGVGVISFALPPPEFHRYLRTIVEAGFGDRLLFGSDQMVWPEAIEFAVDNIEAADYLSSEQKRDIFYNNAARFLRLSDEEIATHHGR